MNLPALAVLALLGSLALEDPGDRVASLVARLDDDSAEIRERATAELLRLGRPALPDLERALERHPSAEAMARIEQLIKELGKPKRVGGGATVAGLSAALRVKAADATSMVLEAEITNVDDAARPFTPICLWNKTLPHQRFASNAAEATIEMTQRSGERPKAVRRAVC
jgi:hypothetical protein